MNTTLKNSYLNISSAVKAAVNSSIYPYVTAVITLMCYYLGLDLLLMYYLAFVTVLIFLFSDDVTPAICCFLFMGIMVSKQNSPSEIVNASDFYSRPSTLIQVGIMIAFITVAMVINFVRNSKSGRMKITPVFCGLAALSIAFLMNGAFSEEYDPHNMLFGFVMAFFWFVVFTAMFAGVKSGGDSFKKSCAYFVAFGLTLLIELAVAYITTDGLFDGGFHRSLLTYGWGVYNTMGMYLTVCIPPVIYLAAKHPRGYLFYILGIALCCGTLASGSRQAMLFGPATFAPCAVLLLVRGKNRRINLIITAIVLTVCVVIAAIFHKQLGEFLSSLFSNFIVNGKPSASGRWTIWEFGVDKFLSAPIFGTGFYEHLPYTDISGLSFLPMMYHNTIIQFAAACGMFGLFIYIVHRAQTVVSYIKNPSFDRTFMALTVLSLLITALVDNHLFYLYPNLIYSSVIAMLIKSEKEI